MNTMTKTDYRTYLAEHGVKTTTKTPLAELRRLYAEAVTSPGGYEVALVNMTDGSVQGHAAGCKDLTRKTRGKVQFADEPWVFGVLNKEDARASYNADFDPETDGWYDINWLPCADHVPAGGLEQPEKAGSTAGERQNDSDPQPAHDEAEARRLQAENDELAADAIKEWRGNYNTVAAPAAEVLGEHFTDLTVWTVNVSTMLRETRIAGPKADLFQGYLGQMETQALSAMKEWQRTLDRKDASDMEKYNENRSYLAGFYAAVAARLADTKRLPKIEFAKDMGRALRADALKAGAAAGKNAGLESVSK